MTDDIVEGSYVLLYFNETINYVVKAKRGAMFNTIRGTIRGDQVVGAKYGDRVTTNLGYEFILSKPDIVDILMKQKRVTQPIYPKDAAIIITYCNIVPGVTVLETGMGSAYLTSMLAMHVMPTGHVVTYERNASYIKIAEKTLREFGVHSFVEIKNQDLAEAELDRDFDAAVLDVAEPWTLLQKVVNSLKHGANVAAYVPTIGQVEKTIERMVELGLVRIQLFESVLRPWKTVPGEVRPQMWVLGHTGFIIIGKKP